MSTGSLTATDRESHDPEDGKDDSDDPEKVQGEPRTEQHENEQQCKYEKHDANLPLGGSAQTSDGSDCGVVPRPSRVFVHTLADFVSG